MKLYVGNLSFNTSESQLRDLFAAHGNVTSASLVMDRDTGRPRGFGFVEMDDDAAQAAMTALNGKNVDGRNLTDELGRVHSSFLKEELPLPGRNIRFTLTTSF